MILSAFPDRDELNVLAEVLGPGIQIILTLEFTRMDVKSGHQFYRAGDLPKDLYVIEHGQLTLKLTCPSEKIVETLVPGTMVGGLDFFSGQIRSLTLYATSDAIVWRLSMDSYQKICKTHPNLMLDFVTKIAVPFDSVRYYNTVHHWAQL